ncbi:hypothetical protein D7Z54_25520 [Salibacterium salarium]|uniref:Uncharacterized protein n=1 Tax=Salibacterium salarium TaxID=284579 RepID=A0A3R9P525_9BACI|nr:hypothetical protein D7Z54_25520 [Salibacterium salarium]
MLAFSGSSSSVQTLGGPQEESQFDVVTGRAALRRTSYYRALKSTHPVEVNSGSRLPCALAFFSGQINVENVRKYP